MHEWRITESLIEEITGHARENGIHRVNRVKITLGEDSHITEDSIRFCFDELKKDEAMLRETVLEIHKRKDPCGIIVESVEGEA
jgi:Zn finger protein HypA/HybF involved in hydrogenase expression